MRLPFAVLATLLTTSCATFIEGTSQSVTVDTMPAGATCNITSSGEIIGSIVSTPGSTHVPKSKNDISFTCSKAGYQTATISQTPHVSETSFLGNPYFGGFIGVGIDAATGANYVYPDMVHLSLATSPLAYKSTQPAPWAVSPEADMR
jgi:hypothetical protein